MKPMSPEDARLILDGAEEQGGHLSIGFWRALETIAGMREEYAVSIPDGQLVGAGWGTYDTALEDMNAWRRDGYATRVVRRYVTEPEEA